MESLEKTRLLKIFEGIKDPRIMRTKVHPLESILGLGFLGALAGIDSFLGLEDFGTAHEEELSKVIPFPGGIPSHDTIGKLFSRIDVDVFHQCFFAFTESLKKKIGGVISVDGKTMKTSGKENPLHIVSAWSEENSLVLGQVKVGSKSNEIKAIPLLLEMLDLDGHIVTIDAIGCQKAIAEKIVNKDGDYLLALKANQKSLFEDVRDYFEDKNILDEMSYWEELDKGHGRIEKRQCWVTSEISWLKKHHSWVGLTTIAMVKSERNCKNKCGSDVRFYISSLPQDAERICRAARMHWGIENKLHWTLDVVFNEDKCCIRKDNAPEIMALMRKWALNTINATKGEKLSTKRAMAKCAMSMKYLFQVLTTI